MFYLLIALTPLNCMHEGTLMLYAVTMFYWILTLLPRGYIHQINGLE